MENSWSVASDCPGNMGDPFIISRKIQPTPLFVGCKVLWKLVGSLKFLFKVKFKKFLDAKGRNSYFFDNVLETFKKYVIIVCKS